LSPKTDTISVTDDIPSKIDRRMPQIRQELRDLARIPSVAANDLVGEKGTAAIRQCADTAVGLLTAAGVKARLVPLSGGSGE
jgi:hypothetical protein